MLIAAKISNENNVMRTKLLLKLFFLCLLSYASLSIAEDRYWLCGPDEDGCPEDGDYEFCACIPYDTTYANQPYCLDFDELTCTPLIKQPHCDKHFIFKDQTSCLATIYHSIPDNPCTLTHYSFCAQHQPSFCDANGNPSSCKRIND